MARFPRVYWEATKRSLSINPTMEIFGQKVLEKVRAEIQLKLH